MASYDLLKKMCAIQAPSGAETPMTNFLLDYINLNMQFWEVQPKLYCGDDFHDCIVMVFGKPRTAIYAHLDSIGFMVRYGNQLVRIGGPVFESGFTLVGSDSKGEIECTLQVDEDNHLTYEFTREIETGTLLTFKPNWEEDEDNVQCCYMDNRLGVYNALKVAEKLQDGMIVFSCWEETGGGSVEFLAKFMYEIYHVKQALISDITWVTDGVLAGSGCVISLRDRDIPRRSYVNRIMQLLNQHQLAFQLEVESSGGSDGNIIHRTPYPIDWCFIGAPELNVHSPTERVHKSDIQSMIEIYHVLMKEL
jgi:putative aminopeptidase FrvX